MSRMRIVEGWGRAAASLALVNLLGQAVGAAAAIFVVVWILFGH